MVFQYEIQEVSRDVTGTSMYGVEYYNLGIVQFSLGSHPLLAVHTIYMNLLSNPVNLCYILLHTLVYHPT